MPFLTVKLIPGVNVEMTPTLNTAGISVSQLIRFKDKLAQKLGGWEKFYDFAVGGVPRALHAWLDLNDTTRLAVGTTTKLAAIADGVLTDITPQQKTTNPTLNFATTSASATVTITDANINTVTTYDSIYFNTPVSVGGLILSGLYPIASVAGATSYRITAAANATSTQANATITAITQAADGAVTTSAAHGFSTGQLIYIYGVAGMTQINGQLVTITSTGANTFTTAVNTSGYSAYTSGGTASPSHVPRFTTASTSPSVAVTLQAHGLATGDTVQFPISTTVGGVTILGAYTVTSITSANVFVITADTAATSTTSASMNSGAAQLVYYITLGPAAAGAGYSLGTYSSGGYSTGTTVSVQTGTPIASDDWSLDNWGEILIACPEGGAIYYWQPGTGFLNARLVSSGPEFNTGVFVSMQTQMLIAYGSTEAHTIGDDQDPLLVKWSAQGDFTDWAISTTTQAGSRRLPTGSMIVGGLSVPQQELLWTDLDLWSMSYLGSLAAGVWGFIKIGSNCGLIGKHATARLGGAVYWMGSSNFFMLAGGGAQPIPCTVWDAVFQDINTSIDATVNRPYSWKSWAWPVTSFNEIFFFYPRASTSATECDAYVKLNTVENTWDYGVLPRSAGIDQSVLGSPIAATPTTSLVYSHETGEDADGEPITAYIESGWFVLAEGQEIVFADWMLPDMKWGPFGGAQTATVQITLYSAMYPGDTPRTYGPFSVTATTKYKNMRLRGRLAKIRISSSDLGSFWRAGGVRLRAAQDGRR